MPRVKPFLLPRGTRIDDYRVVGLLGRGWEGEVYAVREVPSNAERALKLFRYRSAMGVRHVCETARYLERLSPTDVTARYYHMGFCYVRQNCPSQYIVSERLKGTVLCDWLIRRVRDRRFDDVARLRVLTAVADALARIHTTRLAAGDFEHGGNMMIRTFGGGRRVEIRFFDVEFDKPGCPKRRFKEDLWQLAVLAGHIFLHRKRGETFARVRTLLRRHLRARTGPAVMRSLADDLAALR